MDVAERAAGTWVKTACSYGVVRRSIISSATGLAAGAAARGSRRPSFFWRSEMSERAEAVALHGATSSDVWEVMVKAGSVATATGPSQSSILFAERMASVGSGPWWRVQRE